MADFEAAGPKEPLTIIGHGTPTIEDLRREARSLTLAKMASHIAAGIEANPEDNPGPGYVARRSVEIAEQILQKVGL